jgi:hypothetical protein
MFRIYVILILKILGIHDPSFAGRMFQHVNEDVFSRAIVSDLFFIVANIHLHYICKYITFVYPSHIDGYSCNPHPLFAPPLGSPSMGVPLNELNKFSNQSFNHPVCKISKC